MKKTNKKPTLHVQVDADIKKAVEKLAKAEKRTPSNWVRLVLEREISRQTVTAIQAENVPSQS